MSEERARILQMISEGKISAGEGTKLLNALRNTDPQQETMSRGSRWFHIQVTDKQTDRIKVSVNLPLSLVNVATKMGARLSPNIEGVNWEELMEAINKGLTGKIVEAEDEEGLEKFEVFID